MSRQRVLWGNISSKVGCLIVKWGLVLLCTSVPCEHFFFPKELASLSANLMAFPSESLSAKTVLKLLTCLLSRSFEKCTGDTEPGMPRAFCEVFLTRAEVAGGAPGLGLRFAGPAQPSERKGHYHGTGHKFSDSETWCLWTQCLNSPTRKVHR